MSKKVIIFDFDGTLADTMDYFIGVSNKLAKEFKFKTIHKDNIEEYRHMTSQKLFRHLKVPYLKIPKIIARAHEELRNDISSIKPIVDFTDVLLKLNSQGHILGIFSSNSKDNVKAFLNMHNLTCFDFINTSPKIWKKNKGLKKLMKKNGYSKDQVLYVGDETRDVEAAKKLKIKMAAVTWGYNTREALKAKEPDYLIETPTDLLNICSPS